MTIPRRNSRSAATDRSPQRELWVGRRIGTKPRRGDRIVSVVPSGLGVLGNSLSHSSRCGLLSSAPPVLSRPRPSSSRGRAKPPAEPHRGRLLTIRHLAASLVSSGTHRGRARHSERAVGSTGVPNTTGIRRRAEDCPPYLPWSSAGKHRTLSVNRTRRPSERGREGRAQKTSPDGAVRHPSHPRDLRAVFSIPFTTSCSFMSIRG